MKVEPYVYETNCHIDFIESFSIGKIPEWTCKDVVLDFIIEPIEQVNTFNPTVELGVGMLFVLLAGLLGSLIVELLFNKMDLFLNPIEKKYQIVQSRKRLESMNGHP